MTDQLISSGITADETDSLGRPTIESLLEVQADLQSQITNASQTIVELIGAVNALIEFGGHADHCCTWKDESKPWCDCGRDEAVRDAFELWIRIMGPRRRDIHD